jgi:CheY-like chemotaxis protein
MLGGMNLDAEVVENGQTACELAEKSKAEGSPYDLILMDMQMPRMNGFDAVKRLRKHGWEGPIVAVTAYATAADRKKCMDAGCDEFLTKPITEEALQDIITRQISGTLRKSSAVEGDKTRQPGNGERPALTPPLAENQVLIAADPSGDNLLNLEELAPLLLDVPLGVK